MFDLSPSVPTESAHYSYDMLGRPKELKFVQKHYNKRPRSGAGSRPNIVSFGRLYVDRRDAESVQERFGRLAREWEDDTSDLSSLSDIIASKPYQEIIKMGPAVVPLLLGDLAQSRRHWFYALRKITKANPIPAAAAGNMRMMTAAWIAWGRSNGYR